MTLCYQYWARIMQGPNGNTDKFNSIKIKIPHGKKHCTFKKKKDTPGKKCLQLISHRANCMLIYNNKLIYNI